MQLSGFLLGRMGGLAKVLAMLFRKFGEIAVQVWCVRLAIVVGLLVGMGISWKLWFTGERLFPVLPFGGFPRIPVVLEAIMVGGMALFLVASFFNRVSRVSSGLAVVILVLLAVGDQVRWQPWVYQYGLMLLPFMWFGGSGQEALLLKTERFILIAVYFWSGFHKLTPNFEGVWLENFAGPLMAKLDEGSLQNGIKDAYGMVPWVEMGIAVFLIAVRTRWVGVVIACLMHLGILMLIGPLMGDRNVVIWPWNVAMILLVLILFLPRERGYFRAAWRKSGWGSRLTLGVVVVLAGVMPWFSTRGQWDRYLSFHLYSGTEHRYSLVLLPKGLKKLPEDYHEYLIGDPSKTRELNASSWAMKELNVPVVSEGRVMLEWCRAVMAVGDFKGRDCLVHHDVVFSKTLGHQQLWPEALKSMEEIAPLPGKKE